MAEKATKKTVVDTTKREAEIDKFLFRKLKVLNEKGGRYLATATKVQQNAVNAKEVLGKESK